METLSKELVWLEQCIELRINEFSGSSEPKMELEDAPVITNDQSAYADFVRKAGLGSAERLVLITALVPQLKPRIFHRFLSDPKLYQVSGLVKTGNQNALLPSPETVLFLLANENLGRRLQYRMLFDVEHLFYKQSVIDIQSTQRGEPFLNGILNLSTNYLQLFTTNTPGKPRFSEDFPAQLLTSSLGWDDLFLTPLCKSKLDEVKTDLEHRGSMVKTWGLEKHDKAGTRILFYGDSGTGKTLAATLLGKFLNRDVYRVDISQVTSKYVGETSKRLDSMFNAAEHKDWILFFDEGDALMAQRKQSGGNDNVSQYANQDVAFLLQRIETFSGIIIIATNLKNNIDLAFTRRFQHSVRFDTLNAEMQLRFWSENLPQGCILSPEIQLEKIIARYSLSPASIINVIFRLSLLNWSKSSNVISEEDLLRCVRDEEFKYKGREAYIS